MPSVQYFNTGIMDLIAATPLSILSVAKQMNLHGLTEKDIISATRYFQYWDKALTVLFWAIITAATLNIIWKLVKRRKTASRDEKEKSAPVGISILLTTIAMASALFIVHQLHDLHWLWLNRFGLGILFLWLLTLAVALWIFGELKKFGMWVIFGLHHAAGFALIYYFIINHREYRLSFPVLITVFVLLNLRVLLNEKLKSYIGKQVVFWSIFALFVVFLFAPFITHPALRFANNIPKLGVIAVVEGTEGLRVTAIEASKTGSTLYFLAPEHNDALGRLELPSTNPVYTDFGFTGFSSIETMGNEEVLAIGAAKTGASRIKLIGMEPYTEIGEFEMPGNSLRPSRVHAMDPAGERFYALISSDVGTFLTMCPEVLARHAELQNFHAKCAHARVDTTNPGAFTVSESYNKALIGDAVSPFGININMEEWLLKVLRKRQDIGIGNGALAFTYGSIDRVKFRGNMTRHIFIGRPFSEGIEHFDGENFTIMYDHPGPMAISTILAKGTLLAGGSYLEGEIVIHNLRHKKHKLLYVGPGVSDMAFSAEAKKLYVATERGIIQIDLELLFGKNIFWQ